MFQQDYILRMIEDMAQFLSKIAHYHEQESMVSIVDENGVIDEIAFFEYRLTKLYYEGKYCEAEDLLFKKLEQADGKYYINTAIQFYQRLGQSDEQKLTENGYSADRISDGLKRLRALYSLPEQIERFES